MSVLLKWDISSIDRMPHTQTLLHWFGPCNKTGWIGTPERLILLEADGMCKYIVLTQTEWNGRAMKSHLGGVLWLESFSGTTTHISQVSGRRSVEEWVMVAEVAATRLYLRRLQESDLTLCYLIELHSLRLFTHNLFLSPLSGFYVPAGFPF